MRLTWLKHPLTSQRPVAEQATPWEGEMMRRALTQADHAAAQGEVPVGAVVVREGEILAEAHNRRERPPDPAGHAELLAMREAAARIDSWRLDGCTVVVTLEPCPMCAGALVNARVSRLAYGTVDPKAGAVASLYELPTDRRLNHRVEVVGGLLADEAADRLTRFFRSRRRK